MLSIKMWLKRRNLSDMKGTLNSKRGESNQFQWESIDSTAVSQLETHV